ncbi:NTP transferase domain-containing protein [Paracoccus sp. (in: a-proteobacteria)]|uniref:nucleotidyltransferase family protein n=1 Tax=Paracoccus sp. TaxID=267 RepID=UPI00396CFA91
MIRTGLLLAAGASRRFGPQDKLLAPVRGRAMVIHAAEAMSGADLGHRIAVISNPELAPLLGAFTIVTISPGQQSDSLRAGLAAAGLVHRLLVALGDMPDVTAGHLDHVLRTATDVLPAASHDGQSPLPPACFPAASLRALRSLSGDQGAGRLLRDLPPEQLVHAPGLLRDIDRTGDL